MKLFITHSKRKTADHFEALGFEDTYPNMVIRFNYTPQSGWHKWRHGGWLPIDLHEVPAEVMVRFIASKGEVPAPGIAVQIEEPKITRLEAPDQRLNGSALKLIEKLRLIV